MLIPIHAVFIYEIPQNHKHAGMKPWPDPKKLQSATQVRAVEKNTFNCEEVQNNMEIPSIWFVLFS